MYLVPPRQRLFFLCTLLSFTFPLGSIVADDGRDALGLEPTIAAGSKLRSEQFADSSLEESRIAHTERSLLVASRVESAVNAEGDVGGDAQHIAGAVSVHDATAYGVSPPLESLTLAPAAAFDLQRALAYQQATVREIVPSRRNAPVDAASVEQTEHGTKPAAEIVMSFDGLGHGFAGPQGTARFRNPSDNSLAVGPDHIVQTVNTRMAIFTKKGARFDTTGRVLYGPVATNNVFKNCGVCGDINNGDAVVRYDQLADRWLIVMPIFRRLPPLENEPPAPTPGGPAVRSQPGRDGSTWCGRAALSAACADAGRGRRRRSRAAPSTPAALASAAAEPTRLVCDVLRRQHEPRPARLVLSLRIPPAAVSRLSAARRVARRLLCADQHRRQRDSKTRLRCRARKDAARRAGQRAVPRDR